MSDAAEQVIHQDLLDILVCPVDHGELELTGSTLKCRLCGRVYPIENGIPNMLVNGE